MLFRSHAGVEPQNQPAPDYETGDLEEAVPTTLEDEELDEKLYGGQKKLDRNHDGKLDAEDFAMLRREKTDESPLKGQYGHSGKLKAVGDKPDFLTRLKELSGMIRN